MTVRWTESALNDIQALETYIARHSHRYARDTVERLFQRGERLAEQPRLGPAVPGHEAQGLREVLEGSYRMIYRVNDDRVEIIAVVHAARRLPTKLS